MNQGIGVSAGIGIGRAVVLRGKDLDYSMVVPKGSREEKRRLHEAIASFRERTERAAEETRARAGEKQAEILLAQIMMIGDPFMVSQMEDLIGQGACDPFNPHVVQAVFVQNPSCDIASGQS